MLNLPNILTIGRILLSPVFLYVLKGRDNFFVITTVLIVFIIASITDYYDGVLARKGNIVTNFGKILDPIADKLMIGIALYCFVKLGFIFWWVAALIFFREIVVTIHRFYLLKRGIVVAAVKSGKIKTGMQITMVISLLVFMALLSIYKDFHGNIFFDGFYVFSDWVSKISIWGSLVFTIYSGVEYLKSFLESRMLDSMNAR